MNEEKMYDEWIDSLHKAIGEALLKGTASKLSIGSEERTVTIDIYCDSKQMDDLSKLITDAAKEANVTVRNGPTQ